MNWTRYEVTEKEFKELTTKNKVIPVTNGNLIPNSGVEVYTSNGNQTNAIYDLDSGGIRSLISDNPVFKSIPNRDLLLLNDLLLNDNVSTIIVDGFWGTGKTSSICSHLVPKLLEAYKGAKNGIPVAYISKPYELLGKTRGFLPGDVDDKTKFEFQSFTQYFDRYGQPFLADELKKGEDKRGKKFNPMLHLLMFEYLRGRDIDEGWIVLDEAQNTDIKEMSSFVSRVCDNAKLIIIGDSSPTQIDKKGNTSENNGLTFAKNTYYGKKYSGYVELQTVKHILRGQRVRDLFVSLQKGRQL